MRRYTIGMEETPVANDPPIHPFEGSYTLGTSTSVARDTSVKRTGSASRAHIRGGTSALVYSTLAWGLQGLVGYYVRCYFAVSSLPAGSTRIAFLSVGGAGSPFVGARLTAAGKIQLFNELAATQIGSDSSATITTSTWYRLELYGKTGTGAVDECELRLDGTTVASATAQSISDTQIQQFHCGWLTSPGGAFTIWLDDVAVNDDTTGSHNSWPGEGSVVYLSPTADSAVTGSWTAGAGATSNLYDAVDNDPPAGVASGSATNTSQIKNTNTADATGNYEATLESYTAAGLDSGDTISLVQAVILTGTSATTGVTGSLQVTANPVQGSEDSLTFGSGAAAGTYGANWANKWGTAQSAPSVTLGSSPTLEVGRRGTQASEAHVCGVRLAVEFVPGEPAAETQSFYAFRRRTVGR